MIIQAYNRDNFSSANAIRENYFHYANQYYSADTNNQSILTNGMPKAFYDYQASLLKQVIQVHQEEKETPEEFVQLIQDNFLVNKLRNKYKGSHSLHNIYYIQEACDLYFIGDLHSDAYSIQVILEKINFFQAVHQGKSLKLIFLGDYVDRGKQHLKILQYMMVLKLMFPDMVYFLTGNHDIGHIEDNKVTLYLRKAEEDMDYFYLYIQALSEKDPGFSDELKSLYLSFMNNLNIMALITTPNTCIKAVHGGIPRPDEQEGFGYLSNHKQFTDQSIDHLEFRIRDCILWSDPSIQHNQPTLGQKRFKFYENQLINFQDHLGIDTLVRGHQAVEDGYLELFDHRIYTIFSSGQILKDGENINKDTAYDFVMPKVLHYDFNQGMPMKLIDLND